MNRFRNQYILLANSHKDDLQLAWEAEACGDFTLFTDGNLPKFVFQNETRKIVLLGFAFHVLDPTIDEADIVKGFPEEESAFLDYMDSLCGNFLIIRDEGDVIQMYSDAAAVLKMYYYISDNQVLGVASDPMLLGEALPIKIDKNEESRAFYDSTFFTKFLIRVANQTAFENVFQVLPNHSLNPKSNTIHRFFPRIAREELSVEESAKRAHTYFSNIISAATRKYDVKCAVTAGSDTRMLVAFSKEKKDEIDYYTFMHPWSNVKHPDVRIALKIAQKLNLQHEIISKGEMISEENQQIAKSSYHLLPQEDFGTTLGGYCRFDKKRDLVLGGYVSEICKNYFDKVSIVDGKTFAQAAHFPLMTYTIRHFQNQYDELHEVSEKYGYDQRDLMHWEQDVTNFAAKRAQYMSLLTRSISPFNCRLILKTILSSPRSSRDKHLHAYYAHYVKTYWRELSKFPINPTTKKRLMVLGKKTGIYPIYKALSTRLRK